MRMLPRVELDLSPGVRAEFQIAAALDPLDGRQFAVSEFLFMVTMPSMPGITTRTGVPTAKRLGGLIL
jgi:hypothetical protein